MMESGRKTLYIPINIKTRSEFFEGYGKSELYKTILTAVVSGIFILIFYACGVGLAFNVVFMLASVAGSVLFVTKDKNNQSVVDQVGHMIRFARSQKKYKYKHMDEWR